MLGAVKMSAIQRFNHGILTTFGKLDTFDIDNVNGRPDQLAVVLMKYYGWSNEVTDYKVDQFMRQFSDSSL